MNYRDFNDYELLSYIAEANEEASETLFIKYRPLIMSISNKLYKYCKNTGLELNDLIQEGMLGLNLAINGFDDKKNASFYTYAKTCVERKIVSLIISSRRLKHKFLNESISFEGTDDNDDKFIFDVFLEDNSYNPEEVLMNNQNEEELIDKFSSKLTNLESQVLELKINGFNYREIAEVLDMEPKKIDNAIQRIKNKIKKDK